MHNLSNLRLLLLIIALLSASVASAFTSGQYTYKILNYSNNAVSISPTDPNTISSATIPSTVYYNGTYYRVTEADFRFCPNLRSVELASMYMTTINYAAFSGCTALSRVTMYDDITTIGGSAFSGCTALKSITLPESVTSIEAHAFSGCTSLTSLNIPDGVKSIGFSIIEGTAIKSIYIPASVETFWPKAFVSDNLESIEVDPAHEYLYSIDGVLYHNGKGSINRSMIYYPGGKKDTEYTLTVSNIVEPGFNNNKYLQSITLDTPSDYPKVYTNPTYFSKGGWIDSYDAAADIEFKGESIKHINIGKAYTIGKISKKNLPSLQTVEVSPENNTFSNHDGLIYKRYYSNTENKYRLGLWLVTPQAASIKSYTGPISNYNAFDWCNDITEIFDFSEYLGSTKSYDHNWVSLNHLNHPISYYAYPASTSSMGCYLFNEGYDDANYPKINLVFLADIRKCSYYSGDEYDDSPLYSNVNTVYGPKGGRIYSFLSNKSKYAGDLNIIKVNATEDIQNAVTINNHRTHVFGVADGNPVSITFPSLPADTRVRVNGQDMTASLQSNTLTLGNVSNHTTVELYTPGYLTVEANEAISTIYIDDLKQNHVLSDEDHTVHIVPADGYFISSVTLNGNDVSDRLDNKYITIAASNEEQTLAVEILEQNQAKLTVMNPDFRVAHYFNQGDRILVDLTPHEGWEIDTATFNDEDVTSEINSDKHLQTAPLSGNDILAVTYRKNIPTNIENIDTSDEIHVYTRGNAIIIKGKDSDTRATLYDASGTNLLNTTESVIDNLSGGVYILTIGTDRVFKLAI